MTAERTVDVLVVGARVGGVFTAGCFAQHGRSVMVVDRAAFPSDTLSTHFCRGGGLLSVADRLGWLSEIESVGAPRLTREYSHHPDGLQVNPPQDPGDVGYCLAARRITLDSALLDAASGRFGVDVRTRTAVTSLLTEGNRVVGAVLADGTEVRARLVVGADGRRSKVAQWVAAATREEHPGARALYFRYVSGFASPEGGAPDGPEFSLRGDQMAYVFPCEGGVTCVAVSVNLDGFARIRHDAAAGWEGELAQHPHIAARLADSSPESRTLGASPHPDWVRQGAGPGWALVGDAAIHQDPWSGEGMDSAARQGELLADVVHEAWSSGSEEWAHTYEAQRDAMLLDDFHETVEAARDLSVLSG